MKEQKPAANVQGAKKVWLDGNIVDFEKANVHILTHTLHYGLGVFEGIRCYRQKSGGGAIFRLRDHIERLFQSAHIATIPMPWSTDEVMEACKHTVRANGLDECYLRPLAFLGDGAMGLGAQSNPTRLAIVAWKWGAYLGEEGVKRGIRAKVSSFSRPGVNAVMAKGKIVGNYVNSILAKREVQRAGYDEALMLDPQGYVAEGSGENVFAVRKGVALTPHMGSSILGGITRDTVITLLREQGITVVERPVARDELYIADEIFMVGTAAEVTPIRELDDRAIGAGTRGPFTASVQERFFEIVRGGDTRHTDWLSIV